MCISFYSDNKGCAQRFIESTDEKFKLGTSLFISWINRWGRILIRFTDRQLRYLFDLNVVINGKVISLHKEIKNVKVHASISAQNIRQVKL